MLVEIDLPVHTYDVDFMGIVNNTVHVKWFEDLRMAIMDRYIPLTDCLKRQQSPILAETHVQYRKPVTLESKPRGRAWMAMLDRSKWTIQFEIFEGERMYATGEQTGYYFDIAAGRPTRWPEELVTMWQQM